MNYLDVAIQNLFTLYFIIILIVWLIPLSLDIVADFFYKIFNINNKYDFFKK